MLGMPPVAESLPGDELGRAYAGSASAYAVATALLFAALDSLNALGVAVNVSSTSYVPAVLSRAAMEAGAQAWWLLEPSTAQVRSGQPAAQSTSRPAWPAEARTRSWPSGSAAAIA